MRNQGSMALLRVGRSQTEISAALGVANSTTSRICAGAIRPSAELRKKIHDVFRIDPSLFDRELEPERGKLAAAPGRPVAASRERPGAVSRRRPTDALEPPPEPAGDPFDAVSVLDKAAELRELVSDLLATVKRDPSATPIEKARVMQSTAATLNVLAKLTGEYELGRRIFKLPIWRKIEACFTATLRPYPEAASALAAALEKLEREETR